jgi:thiol-disulfide isomerase/thioredoxin
VLLGAIAAVIVAALVAFVVVMVTGDDDSTAMTAFDTTTASVSGNALQPSPAEGTDPAVGQTAPVITGKGRDGASLTAPESGRPTVLLFLAHWCPHCQAEVPVVRDWVDAGNLPDDVDLIGVATAMSTDRPNYPPSAWLDREKWDVPTIADATGVAAKSYGLSAFPFWVAIDESGKVVERRTGELSPAEISSLVALVR